MQREWDPKAFFDQLSLTALAELETWTRGALRPDGDGRPQERFYRAWSRLPDGERERLEALLVPLNHVGTVELRTYLDQLARQTWAERDPALLEESELWTSEDLAVRLFINDSERFAEALQCSLSDCTDLCREYRGRAPVREPRLLDARDRTVASLAREFSERKAKAVVRDFSSSEKFSVLVYRPDLSSVGRAIEKLHASHQGALRFAAHFDYESPTLLVRATRDSERESVRRILGEQLMGRSDYFDDHRERPKFCFDRLRDPKFDFQTRPADHIDHVTVVGVQARSSSFAGSRVQLEHRAGLRVHELAAWLAGHGVRLADDTIEGITLRIYFDEGPRRTRIRTVILSNPNTSNLWDAKRDRLIRRYLREWGFDVALDNFPRWVGGIDAAA